MGSGTKLPMGLPTALCASHNNSHHRWDSAEAEALPSTLCITYAPHRHPATSSGADLARWCEPPRRSLQKRKPTPDRRNPAHQSSRLLLTCHRTTIASPSTMPRTTASLRLRNRARPVDLRCRSEFRAAIEVRPLRGNKVRHSKSTETSTSKAAHICKDSE